MNNSDADFSNCSAVVLDDSELMLELFKSVLKAFQFREVKTFAQVDQAVNELRRKGHDCLITDWLMHPVNGLEITRNIRRGVWGRNREIPIVMCSGYTDMKHIREGLMSGVSEILSKPVTPSAIYDKVYQAIYCPRPFVDTEEYVGPELRVNLPGLPKRQNRVVEDFTGSADEEDDSLALI